MTSWHLNAGDVTPLKLSPLGVLLLPSGTRDTARAGQLPRHKPRLVPARLPQETLRGLSRLCDAVSSCWGSEALWVSRGQGMNSWPKKGTNRRDWIKMSFPSISICISPSHSLGLSTNWRGSSKSFCGLHWMKGFCEYFSARRSHSYLLYKFGFFKYWSFPRWLAVLKLNIASATKDNITHTP